MGALENFVDTLNAFGESTHLPQLKLDDDNACELCINEDQHVRIHFNEQQSKVEFLTEVGDINENYIDKCYACLLKANCIWDLTHGMTLSKWPDALKVLLGYQVPALDLDLSAFETHFKRFIDELKLWKDNLVQLYQGNVPEDLAELC